MRILTTEKAIRLIELNNTLVIEVDRRKSKKQIKQEIEDSFKVKVDSINTLIQKNNKIAYIRLNAKNPAIDIATKLGVI